MPDVQDTLQDRNSKYSPDPDYPYRHFELAGWLREATRSVYGDNIDAVQRAIIDMILEKVSRAIEGGVGGVYHEDNSHDFAGYCTLLSKCMDDPPDE